MTALKRFIIALALILAIPAMPALAQSSLHSSGYIEIKVVDQDDKDIGGLWYLYQGSGDAGQIVRNGTFGETFKVNWGNYFLKAQKKAGYERFEIVGDNPQEATSSSTTVFKVVYYAEGYPSNPNPVVSPVAPAPTTPVVVPTVTPTPTPVTEPVAEPAAAEEPKSTRTPLAGAYPETSSTTVKTTVVVAAKPQPMKLATTGPAGLLSLLVGSGLAGTLLSRRKKTA